MHPYFLIAGHLVATWSVFMDLCCLCMVCAAYVESRYRPAVDRQAVLGMWPWAILGGFAAAHVYYLLATPGRPLSQLSLKELWDPFQGTAVQGGIVGSALVGVLYLRWMKQPVLDVLDVCYPGIALGQAVGRIGCFAAGCCYGKPTRSWLGVAFSHPLSDAPIGVPLHPVQLYETALCALLAVGLHFELKRQNGASGRIFFLYLLGYGVIRFFVQFFRAEYDTRSIFGLTIFQYAALGMITFAATALAWMARGMVPGRHVTDLLSS